MNNVYYQDCWKQGWVQILCGLKPVEMTEGGTHRMQSDNTKLSIHHSLNNNDYSLSNHLMRMKKERSMNFKKLISTENITTTRKIT